PPMRLPRLSLTTAGRFALLGLLSACSSAPSQAKDPPSETDSPGAQCLAAAGATRAPKSDAPHAIEVSHILVRHRQLDRPEGATLSREDACLKALAALEALNSSAEWNETVEQFSDSGKS